MEDDSLSSSPSDFEWSDEEEMTWLSSEDASGDLYQNSLESKSVLVKVESIISAILRDLEEERIPSIGLPSK
jgi:hypothetical protein